MQWQSRVLRTLVAPSPFRVIFVLPGLTGRTVTLLGIHDMLNYQKRNLLTSGVLGATTALLAACGGGGGGSSDGGSTPPVGDSSIPLSTKADLLRAASVAVTLYDVFDPNADSPVPFDNPAFGSSVAASKRNAMRPAVLAARAPQAVAPAPNATQNCRNGGSLNQDDSVANRLFTTFPVTIEVQKTVSTYSACTLTFTGSGSASSTEVYEGSVEEGEGSDQTNDVYDYALLGTSVSGGLPYSVTLTERDSSGASTTETFRLSGLVERGNFGDKVEVRVGGVVLNYSGRSSFSLSTGTASAPVKVVSLSADRATIDGTITYSSSASVCKGGSLAITTVTPVLISSGPTDGVIELQSGSSRARVSFGLDGSAQLTYPNGTSESASATEVTAALDASDCI